MKVFPFIKYAIIGIATTCILANCNPKNEQKPDSADIDDSNPPSFIFPVIPDSLTTPDERAAYASLHFWDSLDFSDTTAMSNTTIVEQAMADYLTIITATSADNANKAIISLMDRLSLAPNAYDQIMDLADKYLYYYDSPMRNERLYSLFLQNAAECPYLDEGRKEKANSIAEDLQRCTRGSMSPDFEFVNLDGKKNNLHSINSEIVLLILFNPNCEECLHTIERLQSDNDVKNLVDNHKLKIAAIAIDGDLEKLKNTIHEPPTGWTFGLCNEEDIETKFVLGPQPSMYLLDSNGRILSKLPPLAEVLSCLKPS